MNFLLIVILRSVQMIFGIIVLALSVQLARGQVIGNAPSTTIYDAFAGGINMIAVIVCMTALSLSALSGTVSYAADGIAALAALAGGIATAVKLKGVSCGNIYEMFFNNLINGGLYKADGEQNSAITESQMTTRCNMNKADSAFLFLAFVMSTGLLVLSFTNQKRVGSAGGATYV